MGAQLNNKMKSILTLIVIVASFCLLLHTTRFSGGLLLLTSSYIFVVLIRDYIMKIDLQLRIGILFLYFQLALALAVCIWSESFFAQIYLLVLIGEFSFLRSKNDSIIFTTVTYACILLGVLIYRKFPPFEQIYLLIPRVIDYFAIFGMSFLAKIAFQKKQVLAEAYEKLQLTTKALEQKTILQERTRISREIHDSVGHTLTSALTGLQTASHAINKDNFTITQEMIDRVIVQLRNGLNDVRSSVHVLRDNVLHRHFILELMKLIDETKKQTNVEIECDIDQTIIDLPPKIELTIYRALQEGLTNGIRHGSSTMFHFSLTYFDQQLHFSLSNNGVAPTQIVYGFGLRAMKERVEEVGGHLSISSLDSTSGVTLKMSIPLQTDVKERSEPIG